MAGNSDPFWRWSVLLLVRPAGFLLFQVLLFGFPGNETLVRAAWPLPVILTNLVCLGLMLRLARLPGMDWRCFYLKPFADEPGWAALNRFPVARVLPARLKSGLAFGLLFACLGWPALSASGWLRAWISAGVLPPEASFAGWLRIAIAVLLPISQAAAEISWYNGLLFPRLEDAGRGAGAGRLGSAVIAYALTAGMFSFQHAFMPFLPDVDFWLRGLAWLPVTLLVGLVVRLFPRFTLGILAIHGLMALRAGLSFL